MKLLYFTRKFGHHDRRFARLFASSGLELCVVSKEAPSPAYAWPGLISLTPATQLSELEKLISRFRGVVERERPDLILAGPLTDCAYIVARADPPCGWIAQSWAFDLLWESERDPAVRACAAEALRACSGVFADCAAIIRHCVDLSGRSDLRSFVVPWGLDLHEMPAPPVRVAVRNERGWGERPVVLHTRGFEPVYGVEHLLAAWADVSTHPAKPLLALAGDGAQREALQQQVVSAGCGDSVAFLGRVEHAELLRLFRGSDLYVSCARSDGTSVSLLEAMSLGAVPIVSAVGGTPEWVGDGVNGWLIDPARNRTLSAGLLAALDLSPVERSTIVESNQAIVRDRADWSQNGPRLVKWLREFGLSRAPILHRNALS